MLISVVIPTLNKAALLAQTLAALRSQDLGQAGSWEIVVVNDGSSDGTTEFLGTMAAAENPWVEVVQLSDNVGRATARNLGAKAATGKYLLFLDDDIVAPPGLVAAHLELLADRMDCGTIGYAVTAPHLIDRPHFHYLDTRGAARLPAGPAPGRYFVTQNAAVPRDAFISVGGFDEGFSGYGFEDMELAFRLEDLAGLHFEVLPAPVPQHVHHHTLAQYFDKKIECGQQSLPRLAAKHPERLAEMQLHHVVAAPGMPLPGGFSRIVRGIADSFVGHQLRSWLAGWPTTSGNRPVLPHLYFRLMNLAVLCCFRQGLTKNCH